MGHLHEDQGPSKVALMQARTGAPVLLCANLRWLRRLRVEGTRGSARGPVRPTFGYRLGRDAAQI
jgi:hypothetical protein